MKRIVSVLLALSLILVSNTYAFAANPIQRKDVGMTVLFSTECNTMAIDELDEVFSLKRKATPFSGESAFFTVEELGLTLERVECGKNNVKVYARDIQTGEMIYVLEDVNGKTLLNNVELESIVSVQIVRETMTEGAERFNTRASSWGNWSAWSTVATINTGGLGVAVTAGLIALYAGWSPIGVVAFVAAAVAGKYDTLTIKMRVRYRTDAQFLYYERETRFYGDGTLIRTFTDSGRNSL